MEQKGQRVSIGASVEMDATGYLIITKLIENSPAQLGGLKVGDIIVSIDGNDVKALSFTRAERMLKGAPGTKVTIVYRRDGVDASLPLLRKELDIKYVESRMIGTNGYIKILEFNNKTYSQFKPVSYTHLRRIMEMRIRCTNRMGLPLLRIPPIRFPLSLLGGEPSLSSAAMDGWPIFLQRCLI